VSIVGNDVHHDNGLLVELLVDAARGYTCMSFEWAQMLLVLVASAPWEAKLRSARGA
jgi:hypothetical protein